MAEAGQTVAVTVRIEKGAEARLEAIAADLKAAGLANAEVRSRFLMVQGDVASSRLEALGKIAGVASVRADRSYKTQG